MDSPMTHEFGITSTITPAGDAERPLVSIGVAVYNEAKHLAEALDSLCAQDYRNIEIIISDNASTDATPQICADYLARDPRIRYHRKDTNTGSFDNFNRVLDLARGEFFMWASGHDVRHPSQVSRCVEAMLEDPGIVLCYTQMIWIDSKGRPLEPLERGQDYIDTRGLELSLLRVNVVLWGLRGGQPSYGVFKTQALKKTPVYTHIVSPDMALLIELAAIGKFAYISDPLLYVRRGETYDNWPFYLSRHFPEELHGRKTERLYWRMMREVAIRVVRHIRTVPGKVLAFFSVVVGMWVNFRWMLTALRSVKSAQTDVEPQKNYKTAGNQGDVRSDAKGA